MPSALQDAAIDRARQHSHQQLITRVRHLNEKKKPEAIHVRRGQETSRRDGQPAGTLFTSPAQTKTGGRRHWLAAITALTSCSGV